MKSPSTRPGIIEAEGIRNGSTIKERKPKTIKMTGKRERAYRTGSDALVLDVARRRRLRMAASATNISPLTASRITRICEKSISAALTVMTVDSSRVSLSKRSNTQGDDCRQQQGIHEPH